jgi:hypothetical protein
MIAANSDAITQQILAALEKLREHRWLTFAGREALDLMRKVMRLRQQPILIVYCERRAGWGPRIYEYFVPVCCLWEEAQRKVTIFGTIGPNGERCALTWQDGKVCDQSGTYISYVCTLPEYFPREEIEKITLAPLDI